MKIQIFGVLTEVIGDTEIEMKGVENSENLKERLYDAYPFLKNYRFELAVNREIIAENTVIQHDDELALLPPFSGG